MTNGHSEPNAGSIFEAIELNDGYINQRFLTLSDLGGGFRPPLVHFHLYVFSCKQNASEI